MIKLNQHYIDRLEQKDTKDLYLVKLNIKEKTKRLLAREDYIRDCIRASVCPYCGDEELPKSTLCDKCDRKTGKTKKPPG
jgi:uncharacterized OB-fold protein